MSKVRIDLKRILGRRGTPHRVIIAKGEDIKSFTVRPWVAAGLLSIVAAFGLAYLGATAYLIYRDDLFAASLVRQERIRHAYEDRIAELRAQIDRVTSRQVVNQETLDAKMEALIARQATLNARQVALSGLGDMARQAGIDLSSIVPKTGSAAAYLPGNQPSLGRLTTNGSGLRSTTHDAVQLAAAASRDNQLATVEQAIDSLERSQATMVSAVAEAAARKSQRIAGVIDKLGLDLDSVKSGIGGPYEPLSAKPNEPFASALATAAEEVGRLGILRIKARDLPLWRPIPEATVTSRFGVRMDPFLKRPSLHSGTDFRASAGHPIRATAAGVVVEAGISGGYGKMVEVDHGNGVKTRYAHMERILVEVGQRVTSRTVLGRVGSTGRSTGPHLHYEVRIDDKPVDPSPFIRAGGELRGLL